MIQGTSYPKECYSTTGRIADTPDSLISRLILPKMSCIVSLCRNIDIVLVSLSALSDYNRKGAKNIGGKTAGPLPARVMPAGSAAGYG